MIQFANNEVNIAKEEKKRNTRESVCSYCIHHRQNQFIVLLVNYLVPNISHILLQGKGSVTGEIDNHEKGTTHRDSMLTYFPRTSLRVGATVEKTNSRRV